MKKLNEEENNKEGKKEVLCSLSLWNNTMKKKWRENNEIKKKDLFNF